MLKKVNYTPGEDLDMYEYYRLQEELAKVEEHMEAADWMWLRSEWNDFKIKATSLRKRIGNIKKALSEEQIYYV